MDKDKFTTLVQVPHFLSLAQNSNVLCVIKEASASSLVGEELPMEQKNDQLLFHTEIVLTCAVLYL